jgi:hypothetical protein
MRRGAWHQLGYNSQRLIIEQLEAEIGVGVILSPRYLNFDAAHQYAAIYAEHGAAVLHDPEFYVPESDQGKLGTYPAAALRASVSSLMSISDNDLDTRESRVLARSPLRRRAGMPPSYWYPAVR